MSEHAPTCDHCGEPATRKAPYSDQPICEECYRRMYEDGGDSPLGGMGYGIDYREAQAEARRLK